MASAGRGFLYITAAKGYFMLAGFVTQIALARLLGPEGFGEYSVANRLVSFFNNCIVAATIAGVSRSVVHEGEGFGIVTRTALKTQAALGAVLCGILFAVAHPIGQFLRDPGLVPYIQGLLGVTLFYAVYTVFVGTANGRQQFHKQAGLDATFSTLKTVCMVGAAGLGLGVGGAVGGFVVAAGLIVLVAAAWVGVGPRPAPGATFPLSRFGSFFGQMFAYVALQNVLLAMDILLLKRLSTEGALAAGMAHEAAAARSSELAGTYNLVQQLSQLPFQGVLAITFVIFPLISKSTFEGDVGRTREYVRSTLRYTLLLAAAIAVPFLANPTATILLVAPKYVAGGAALQVLSLGGVLLAALAVTGSILNGAGYVRDALAAVGTAVVAIAAVAWVQIPRASDPLLWAALATTIGVGLGVAVGGLAALRRFGAYCPALSAIRVAVALGGAVAVGNLVPTGGKVLTLLECVAAEIVLVGLLFAMRELRVAELRSVLQRRRQGGAAAGEPVAP